MLRLQLDILDKPDTNPFQCDEFASSEIEHASPIMVGIIEIVYHFGFPCLPILIGPSAPSSPTISMVGRQLVSENDGNSDNEML